MLAVHRTRAVKDSWNHHSVIYLPQTFAYVAAREIPRLSGSCRNHQFRQLFL